MRFHGLLRLLCVAAWNSRRDSENTGASTMDRSLGNPVNDSRSAIPLTSEVFNFDCFTIKGTALRGAI